MKKCFGFLKKYVEDFFIITGLAILAGTTFSVNIIAGWYTVGAISLGIGIFFAKFPLRR
jgi:hypothetical protein